VNIGAISHSTCEQFNLTGVLSRSVGIKRDLRLSHKDTYSNYELFSFKSYFGVNGDSFDRYLIRMMEMGESLHICNLVINKLTSEKNVALTNSIL